MYVAGLKDGFEFVQLASDIPATWTTCRLHSGTLALHIRSGGRAARHQQRSEVVCSTPKITVISTGVR